MTKCQNMKQKLTELNREIIYIIVEDFNISLQIMHRITRQKINKEIKSLDNIIHQLELTDIYRIFHSVKAEYSSLKCTWNIHSPEQTICYMTKKVLQIK